MQITHSTSCCCIAAVHSLSRAAAAAYISLYWSHAWIPRRGMCGIMSIYSPLAERTRVFDQCWISGYIHIAFAGQPHMWKSQSFKLILARQMMMTSSKFESRGSALFLCSADRSKQISRGCIYIICKIMTLLEFCPTSSRSARNGPMGRKVYIGHMPDKPSHAAHQNINRERKASANVAYDTNST